MTDEELDQTADEDQAEIDLTDDKHGFDIDFVVDRPIDDIPIHKVYLFYSLFLLYIYSVLVFRPSTIIFFFNAFSSFMWLILKIDI